ncbi:MAG: creatininase family protein [Thiolinea sp.]
MNDSFEQVRIELKRPGEIRAALAACPVVYMPLGTYEYHQEHLPIGLDALTAQGICLTAAAEQGGLVCPPLYYGADGDHADMPFTVMMPTVEQIEALLEKSIQRFAESGVRLLVLLSGHFAPAQVKMVEDLAARWNASDSRMKVLGLAMNMGKDIPMKPDHAGMFETTLLGAFWHERIDMTQLPPLQAVEDVDKGQSSYGRQRLDPAHPLYGIIGADPRHYDPAQCEALLGAMMRWFNAEVAAAYPQ